MTTDRIKSYKVDAWTKHQCRYCFTSVASGELLYKADDGDICFKCLNDSFGYHCECGEEVRGEGETCFPCQMGFADMAGVA